MFDIAKESSDLIANKSKKNLNKIQSYLDIFELYLLLLLMK